MYNSDNFFQESVASNLLLATIIYQTLYNAAKDILEKDYTLFYSFVRNLNSFDDLPFRHFFKGDNTKEILGVTFDVTEELTGNTFNKKVLSSVLDNKLSNKKDDFDRLDMFLNEFLPNHHINFHLSFCISNHEHAPGGMFVDESDNNRFLYRINIYGKREEYESMIYTVSPSKSILNVQALLGKISANKHMLVHEIIHFTQSFADLFNYYLARKRSYHNYDKGSNEFFSAYYSDSGELDAYTAEFITLIESYIEEESLHKLNKKDFQSVEAFQSFWYKVRQKLYMANDKAIVKNQFNNLFSFMPSEAKKKMVKRIADYFIDAGLL